MAVRRTAKFGVELKNLKELKVTFSQIAHAVGIEVKMAGRLQSAGLAIQNAYRAAAHLVRDKARTNAISAGTPRRLYQGARPAIFAFSDFDAARDDKRKRSSLVGVRTGLSSRAPDPHLYIRWGVGHERRKGGGRALRGLSMSLGALFERGTKDRRIKAGRYFRSAIWQTRGQVINILRAAYHSAIARINSIK